MKKVKCIQDFTDLVKNKVYDVIRVELDRYNPYHDKVYIINEFDCETYFYMFNIGIVFIDVSIEYNRNDVIDGILK